MCLLLQEPSKKCTTRFKYAEKKVLLVTNRKKVVRHENILKKS